MTAKVELVANKDDEYRAEATLYRFERGYRPKVVRDTKKVLDWFFDEDNVSFAVQTSSIIAGFIIIGGGAGAALAYGKVGVAAFAATIAVLFVAWVAFLHAPRSRRITDKKAQQLTLALELETDSSLRNGIDFKEDVARMRGAVKKVQERHHDTLVGISDALAEVRRAGTNDPDVTWESRRAIQRLVNIEKKNSMSVQEMERAIASAKDKLSATHSMLDYLEEEL